MHTSNGNLSFVRKSMIVCHTGSVKGKESENAIWIRYQKNICSQVYFKDAWDKYQVHLVIFDLVSLGTNFILNPFSVKKMDNFRFRLFEGKRQIVALTCKGKISMAIVQFKKKNYHWRIRDWG